MNNEPQRTVDKNPKQLQGSLSLLLAALIWGMAFSAQSSAMDHIGPFTFTAARSLITFLSLLIFVLARPSRQEPAASWGPAIKLGLPLGVILFLATVLQQLGLVHTTAAKSGFITALYIVIVPLLGLFLGKKISLPVWGSVLLSLIGLCLLCLKEDLSIGAGDLLTLGCALVFSIHIVAVDRFAANLDSAKLCCAQFGAAGAIALLVSFFTEGADFSGLGSCWMSLLYVGVLSGAVGYTLQISGQKHTDPTLASLLLCLESVFAAIGGWLILREPLLPKEMFGCALMLLGCVLAQIPVGKRRNVPA